MNTTIPTRSTAPRRAVHRLRPAMALTALLLAGTALVACSSDDHAASTTAESTTAAPVRPPVVVAVDRLEGTAVEVRTGGTIDITTAGSDVAGWRAEIADPDVVRFVPGVDGTATFNPGLVGAATGESRVTLTDAASGSTVTFTVRVIAG